MQTSEVLAPHLLQKDCPIEWRRPNLPRYDGKTDPKDHLHSFIIGTKDVTTREDIWCQMFRRTLKEEAIGWYQRLPKGSIPMFFELKSALQQAYSRQRRRKVHNMTLLNIEQGANGMLIEYIKRFATTVQSIDKPLNEVAIFTLQSGQLNATNYAASLTRKPTSTLVEQ